MATKWMNKIKSREANCHTTKSTIERKLKFPRQWRTSWANGRRIHTSRSWLHLRLSRRCHLDWSSRAYNCRKVHSRRYLRLLSLQLTKASSTRRSIHTPRGKVHSWAKLSHRVDHLRSRLRKPSSSGCQLHRALHVSVNHQHKGPILAKEARLQKSGWILKY